MFLIRSSHNQNFTSNYQKLELKGDSCRIILLSKNGYFRIPIKIYLDLLDALKKRLDGTFLLSTQSAGPYLIMKFLISAKNVYFERLFLVIHKHDPFPESDVSQIQSLVGFQSVAVRIIDVFFL